MNIATCLEVCSEDMRFTGYIVFHPKDVSIWTQSFLYWRTRFLNHTRERSDSHNLGWNHRADELWNVCVLVALDIAVAQMPQRSKFLSLSLLQLWPSMCCLISLDISFLLSKTRRLAELLSLWRMLVAKPGFPTRPREEVPLWRELCYCEEFSTPMLTPPSPGGCRVPRLNPWQVCRIPPPPL